MNEISKTDIENIIKSFKICSQEQSIDLFNSLRI